MRDRRYLIYRWYDQLYAIRIDDILSVVGIEDMVKTNRPELKISTYNQRTLPVIDAVSIFSIQESQLTKESKILILDKQGVRFGLLVGECIGVERVGSKDIEEASINEKKFVTGVYKGIRIIDPEQILTSDVMRRIVSASNMDVGVVLSGMKAHEPSWDSRDYLLNEVKMEILNLLLSSNNKNMSEEYLEKVTNIHQMVGKI